MPIGRRTPILVVSEAGKAMPGWPEGGSMTAQAHPEGGATAPREPTAWVGWILFAAIMMVLLGMFHVVQGFVAVFNSDYFVVGPSGLVVSMDYTAWGWTHVVGGIVVAVAGVCLFTGQMWARVVGVVLAVASAIVNIAFLAAYPLWSLIMIALDVFVILALTVHGSEIRELD
jgi:hypothetical protein